MLSFLKSLFVKSEKPKVSLSFPSGWNNLNPIHKIPDCTNVLSGTDFGNSILNIPANQTREDAVYQQCLNGNIPLFMRNFQPINVSLGNKSLTYFVSPDVLCIGTDQDYLRICLNGQTSKKIADLFGCILPTKVIADQIWKAADIKLMPTAMGANFEMVTSQTMIQHNSIIQKQLNGRSFQILTGHKKDIVICKRLQIDHGRLAIYGWFLPSGVPIQGPGVNSTSHDVRYCDYSNSTRLVSRNAILNGQAIDMLDLLSGLNASLISDEGPYDAEHIYL